jgi:hypothetical protein
LPVRNSSYQKLYLEGCNFRGLDKTNYTTTKNPVALLTILDLTEANIYFNKKINFSIREQGKDV